MNYCWGTGFFQSKRCLDTSLSDTRILLTPRLTLQSGALLSKGGGPKQELGDEKRDVDLLLKSEISLLTAHS